MKTAVEWLYEDLFPKQLDGFSEEEWRKINAAFEKAKEMEKEQIVKAYELPACFTPCDDGCYREKTGEQYYNETFKSE